MHRIPVALCALILLLVPAAAAAKQLPEEGSGTISVAPGSELRYQGFVRFDTGGTEALRNPRIWVECWKPWYGNRVVYGEGGSIADVFKLGGDSSLWVQEGGGPAWCSARLYYILSANRRREWNGNGAQGGTVTLAETEFFAGENA